MERGGKRGVIVLDYRICKTIATSELGIPIIGDRKGKREREVS